MKTSTKILIITAIATSSLFASKTFSAPGIEHQSLGIIRTIDPIFPAKATPFTSYGETQIAISVDADGKLTDCLVLGYTRKEFAEEALRAIKQWQFVPATYGGKPVAVVTELDIEFRATGVVVSLNVLEHMERVLIPMRGERLEYAPCGLKDIDRIPLPVNVIAPQYPAVLATQGVKGEVVIVFYIDEQGQVRMPAIQDAADLRLADLALDAIAKWKFEPPTRHGTPVLVRASQTFKFLPKEAPKVESQTNM